MYVDPASAATLRLPSAKMPAPKPDSDDGFVAYEGELADREALAQLEIARKRTQIAPLYNKGGYQFIGDAPPEIIKGLGRKT